MDSGDSTPEPAPEEDEPKGNRRKGKADKRLATDDWARVESEYLFGIVKELPGGKFERFYPSYAQLGRRHGINKSTVGAYGARHNWGERRDKFIAQMRSQYDSQVAEARAVGTTDGLGIVARLLAKFEADLGANKLKLQVADLERIYKLRAFLKAEQAGAAERGPGLSLNALERRHAATRTQALALSPEMTGAIPSRLEREAGDELSSAERTRLEEKPKHKPGRRQDDPFGPELPDCYWTQVDDLVEQIEATDRARLQRRRARRAKQKRQANARDQR